MLGWMFLGKALNSSCQAEKTFLLRTTRDEFEQMCSVEALGLKGTPGKQDDCHKDFMDKLQQLEGGTCITRLPWKEDANSCQ